MLAIYNPKGFVNKSKFCENLKNQWENLLFNKTEFPKGERTQSNSVIISQALGLSSASSARHLLIKPKNFS